MKNTLHTFIREKSNEILHKINGYREYIHANPELSFEEYKTAEFVIEKLKELNIPCKTIGKTGVVGLIMGDHHSLNNDFIGLRADLDALPIQEENEVPYKSTIQGKMHACGHDVHTSILLGAAEILVAKRNELPQPIKLIFQPGEEKNPGGASILITEGVLKNPSVKKMFALHVFPEMEVGKVGFKEGLYMASCDEIYITIHGKGGHGAMPHQCIDPILIGANIVTSLQQIVSRSCDPKTPCVLSFGHFEGLGATNVIPSTVYLKGTFRTMDEDWRSKALELIKSQVESIATTFGGTAVVEISKGYPCLYNNEVLTKELKIKSEVFLGSKNVEELPIRLTSEDFAFYSQEIPVCFVRLGVGNNEKGITFGVHHPRFDIDKNALVTGMQVICLAALD
jgi:amidohydrolase